MKTAEIIAVGSEMLTPERLDTNSLLITKELNGLGVEVVGKHVIGDDLNRLTGAIREALARTDILILCGGLGPTEDDLTREAAAAALNKKLIRSLDQEAVLVARFRQINRPMAPNNLKQVCILEGADVMKNPNGTAPGQFLFVPRGALALLPGPPREMEPMLRNELIPRLRNVVPPQVIRVRSFRIAGMGESDLDALISPIYKQYENPRVTVLAAPSDISVHLTAHGTSEAEAEALLRKVGNAICDVLGDRVYTENADETLDQVVGRLLRKRRASIATAESCTGGLLSMRLTETGGSSDYFVGGYVTYSEKLKREVLGVPAELIEQHSAVSEPVARAMAEGARMKSGATYAIAITGYAGPTGGTDLNPVGTVYIALAGPKETRVQRFKHSLGRERIRALAAQNALDMLRRRLIAGDA